MGLRWKSWVVGLVVAWSAEFGLGTPAPAPGGQQVSSATVASNGPSSGASASLPQLDHDYVIGPADDLEVSVWKDPDLSAREVAVRPDGKISLPLLGDIRAQGLTPNQLAANITERLHKYLSDPRVNVSVKAVNSQRYYVLGEVAHTGSFPLLTNMTVLQALSTAGGLSQFAKAKHIYVLRNENGQQVKLPFNYKNVVKGQHVEQNVVLKAGDTIMVP
jgi:polysaccharide biosynthesis/export protein